MCAIAGSGRDDAEHWADPGPDPPPLLPPVPGLARPDPPCAVPAVGGLPPAVPALVRAGLVPVQVGQPAATGLPVRRRRHGSAGQSQPLGRDGSGQRAGEPDLGALPEEERWRQSDRRLAAENGPAVDPHEGSGRGPAAGAASFAWRTHWTPASLPAALRLPRVTSAMAPAY